MKKFDVSALENLTKDKRKYISLSFFSFHQVFYQVQKLFFSTSTELKKNLKHMTLKLSYTKTLTNLTLMQNSLSPSKKYMERAIILKIDEGIAGNREDNKKMSGRQWAK